VEIWVVVKLESEYRLLITSDPLITPEQLDRIRLSWCIEQLLRSEQPSVVNDGSADR